MREVLEEVERWHAAGQRIALATVVSVAGSAPRAVGATLAVSEGGEIAGSVSGGCVEPAVIEEGMRSIHTGRPKLLQYGITEEQNVEQIGLSCGGEIRVFVERLEEIEPLAQALRAEKPIIRATVIAAPATASVAPGARLTLGERSESTGTGTGTLGDSVLDMLVLGDVPGLLRAGESTTRSYALPSGETVEVFFGVYPAPPTLIIVGAGHVSIPLSRMAKVLGYRVIVVDAREAFATRERLPDADEILVEWPDEALSHLPLTSATAVAVLTHDEKFDVPALDAALHTPVFYVGAIGSRGTRRQRDERLRALGLNDAQIARIHGPIGLSIGAKTPEEIALAILAQIVAVRRGSEAEAA